ncbi:MAG: CatB-related O-acetyltransferase [bacterium]|nr:CatB-related O-acetyltransferase [bacterium]
MLHSFQFFVSRILRKARFAAIRDSFIHPASKIESGTSFISSSIDRYSFCGYDCDIYLAKIGAFTSIANGVVLGGARHPMEWVSTSPVFYAGRDSVKAKFAQHKLMPHASVRIGHDVWIGRSAIVLAGVTVGDGSVIGAGSVVTKDVPPYAIVAGNPARLIRYRFETSVIQKLQEIEWWNFSDKRLARLGGVFNDIEIFLDVAQAQSSD